MGWPAILVNVALTAIAFAVNYSLRNRESAKREYVEGISNGGVPLASEGDPIPIVLGKAWITAPNTVYYKSRNTWTKTDRTPHIYVEIDMAVCSGPDVTLHKLDIQGSVREVNGTSFYNNLQYVTESSYPPDIDDRYTFFDYIADGEESVDLDKLNKPTIIWYDGSYTQQSVYAYAYRDLTGSFPSQYPSYRGVAHAVILDWIADEYNGTLPSLSFLVSRYPNPHSVTDTVLIMPDGSMNIALAMLYLLEDDAHGLNLSSTQINVQSFLDAAVTLASEQNGIGIALSNIVSIKSTLEEMLDQADAILYQDMSSANPGELVLKLIRNDYGETSLLAFDESNVVRVEHWSKSSWCDVANTVRIVYTDLDSIDKTLAVGMDDALAESSGRKKAISLNYPGILGETLATSIAKRELGSAAMPYTKLALLTNRQAHEIKVGDVFTFSWTEYGVLNMYFRVVSVTDTELTDGKIRILAMEDRYADSSGFANNPGTGWQADDLWPDQISSYEVIEAPWWMARGGSLGPFNDFYNKLDTRTFLSTVYYRVNPMWSKYLYLAKAPNNASLYSVWHHDDENFDPEREAVPNILKRAFTPSGIVSSAYPVEDWTGFGEGLIDTVKITDVIPDGTAFRSNTVDRIRRYGKGLMYCNGEFAAYEGVESISLGNYKFTNVHRGLFGTPFTKWTGERIYFVEKWRSWISSYVHLEDPKASKYAHVAGEIGEYPDPHYFKFQEHNGKYVNSRDDATIHAVGEGELTAFAPLPPTYVTVNDSRFPDPVSGIMIVKWRQRSTRLSSQVDLFDDPSITSSKDDEMYYNVIFENVSTGEQHTVLKGVKTTGVLIRTDEYPFALQVGNGTYRVKVYSVWFKGSLRDGDVTTLVGLTGIGTAKIPGVTLVSKHAYHATVVINNP